MFHFYLLRHALACCRGSCQGIGVEPFESGGWRLVASGALELRVR